MPLLFAKATIYTINKKLFQGDIELPKQFTQSLKWTIGGLSTLLFSAAHDGFMSFPIQPLVSGAFSWYLMQEKGFIHAFLAHSTNNTLSLALKSWSEWMLDE